MKQKHILQSKIWEITSQYISLFVFFSLTFCEFEFLFLSKEPLKRSSVRQWHDFSVKYRENHYSNSKLKIVCGQTNIMLISRDRVLVFAWRRVGVSAVHFRKLIRPLDEICFCKFNCGSAAASDLLHASARHVISLHTAVRHFHLSA
jgi:hypothetical protein